MQFLLLALGISVATVSTGTVALAQNYPWCAYYDNGQAGENCGFVSFPQCMATLSGMGGYCGQNTQYVPARAPAAGPVAVTGSHARMRHTLRKHS